MSDPSTGLRLGHKLHDSFFRAIFGRPRTAAAALRGLLPAPLVAGLDLDRIAPASGDLVTRALRQRHADLIYEIPFADYPAHVVWMYEHETLGKRLAVWRALDYGVLIMRDGYERFRAEHHRDPRALPAVIPLVLHTGRRPWRHPTCLSEVIDLPPPLRTHARPYLPELELHVDELHATSDDALRARRAGPIATLGWLLLKHAPGAADLADRLRQWRRDLSAADDTPGGRDALGAMAEYSMRASNASHEAIGRAFRDALGPDGEELVVTTGQELEALAEARGIERGKTEGRAQGKAEALLRVLTLRFGALPEPLVARITRETRAEVIDGWFDRVLAVATPEALVDDAERGA